MAPGHLKNPTRYSNPPSKRFMIGTVLQKKHFIALTLLLIGAMASPDLEAHRRRRTRVYEGPFTSTFESGPGCINSPIFLCTHGVLEGDLAGTYEFSFTSMGPANDPNEPNKILYTGTSIITLENGKQLFGVDTGVMYTDEFGGATFTTIVDIQGGTRNFRHATGTIIASGQLSFVTGFAEGSYHATITRPRRHCGHHD
jgi:hypothetical protein